LLRATGADPAAERAEVAAEAKDRAIAQRVQTARWKRTLADAGYDDAVAEGDHEKAGRILAALYADRKAQTQGEKILAAARRRDRMDGGADERPAPSGLAAQIVAAGRKRRGEA
jgi:hypothetical protein